MSSSAKRDREWEASASGGASAAPAADSEPKRPRISSSSPALSSDASCTSQSSVLAAASRSEAHPMAVLDAIRAKLQSTKDPHLQARLLLQYSAAAASPGAKTAAAIDFLFSFLQQNQTQAEGSADGSQASKDAGSSGAIVVGAIVRGLRQLLAVKAAVVEPMIQVDAMGEQLMQCMSVGEDFKLRRDMMRIVVDCLMLTGKFKQVETLLHTCVQDHDTGMQAICLRGYLRLHEAGRSFAAAAASSPEAKDGAADHFDRLTAFVLFAQSEKVRVLAAQVLVALADLHPQHEVASSKFFPSATTTTTKTTLFLPEKAFYVLCMAGNDASEAVRAEVARCLRGFSRVLASEVVEHAVVKTQIDEAVLDVAHEDVEMNRIRMMSSGVLLSLLEDLDVDVAAEASRTITRLSEMAAAPNAGNERWSLRALERAITAHLDVLPRASAPSASELCRVLVSSLGRLLVCRDLLDTKTDFTVSSADLGCLLRSAASSADNIKPAFVEILLMLQYCDLSSAWAVQRLVDFVLDTVTSASFDFPVMEADDGNDGSDCWDKQLFVAARILGKKCIKVFQADVDLSDRVRKEASSKRCGQHHLVKRVCQLFLGQDEDSNGDKAEAVDKPLSDGSSLFFLKSLPTEAPRTTSVLSVSLSPQVASSMDALQQAPVDGNAAGHLKAVRSRPILFFILLGRVGLVLALLQQNSSDSLLTIEKLRWISKEATRLRFLVSDNQYQGDVWLPTQLLSDVSSLNDLKRAFVAIIRKAWPTALIRAAIARCTPTSNGSDVHYRRLAVAHAGILEPTTSASAKPEPREITANWPFKQRVRFLMTNARDITQVYVKSILPNGDVEYNHVPARCIHKQGPRKYFIDHEITLTVSPFSDPTVFTVAACLGHPTLPGSVKVSEQCCARIALGRWIDIFRTLLLYVQPNAPGSGETTPQMFVELSPSVRVPIFHRTSSTLRHAAARATA
ncbi:unnamed protein product [Phytophthora lilii]|uniref:Unnamed protein product n=1 Tax=Phytophthora lilii TaxID=2077276 RepID=A0A9W6TLR4_9STRA|nr:unnamed protein product [Phytophthora lilii]